MTLAEHAFDMPFSEFIAHMLRAEDQGKAELLINVWKTLANNVPRLAERAINSPLFALVEFINFAKSEGQYKLLEDLWRALAVNPERLVERVFAAPLPILVDFMAEAHAQDRYEVFDNFWNEIANDTNRLYGLVISETAPGIISKNINTLIRLVPADRADADSLVANLRAFQKKPQPSDSYKPPDRTHHINDNASGEDQLEFHGYVQDFARLIAAKGDGTAPLAIGLMGRWGSGKSFFMKKLAQEARKTVDNNAGTKDSPYVKRMAHITFNAWHYADTNLWANLATRIYDGLAAELNGDKSEPEKTRQKLHSAIKSSQQALSSAQERQAKSIVQRDEARQELDKLRYTKDSGRWDILNLLSDPKQSLELLRKLTGQLGLSTSVKNIEDVAALQTSLGNLKQHVGWLAPTLGKTFSSWRSARKAIAVIALAFIASAVFGAVVGLIIDALSAPSGVTGVSGGIAQFGALVSAGAIWASQRINEVNKALKATVVIKDAFQGALEAQAQNEANRNKIEELQKSLRKTESEIALAVEKRDTAEKRIAEAQNEIQRIDAGGLVYDFLSEKESDEEYRSQLGLISTIRKDFKDLEEILADWENSGKSESTEESKIEKEPDNQLPIERVVLYIDDLDRCHPNRVVEVLQAVHLLLAFRLFVVVVGVDPHWLERSLYKAYVTDLDGNYPRKEINRRLEKFSPTHYLEKIFQIPFAVPNMQEHGFHSLIDNLTDQENGKAADSIQVGEKHQIASATLLEEDATPDTASSSVSDRTSAVSERELQSEALQLKQWEVELLKRMQPFIESPRLTKRLVNLYRLLRLRAAHESKYFNEFIAQNDGAYRYAMLLLAIRIGHPHGASLLFKTVLDSQSEGSKLEHELENFSPQRPAFGDMLPKDELDDAKKAADKWAKLLGRGVPEDLKGYVPWVIRTKHYSFDMGSSLMAEEDNA